MATYIFGPNSGRGPHSFGFFILTEDLIDLFSWSPNSIVCFGKDATGLLPLTPFASISYI